MSKDYSQGKVYGIYFEDKLRYIGSTVLDLPKRMSYHRQDAKKESKKSFLGASLVCSPCDTFMCYTSVVIN